MQIKIPYNRRELDGENLVDNRGEITAVVDMTAYAEERWEAHFKANAEKETVFAYVERITKAGKAASNSAAVVLSNLKALYCFLESPDLPDAKTFIQLFDLSDGETLTKQIKVIETAFNAVLNSSAANSKN